MNKTEGYSKFSILFIKTNCDQTTNKKTNKIKTSTCIMEGMSAFPNNKVFYHHPCQNNRILLLLLFKLQEKRKFIANQKCKISALN